MRRYNKPEYKEWRKRVIFRDEECVICGHPIKFLNAHHLIPKEFKKYEYHMDNGIALCPQCHSLGKFSAHKNPIWFAEWMRINRPKAYNLARKRLIELENEKEERL